MMYLAAIAGISSFVIGLLHFYLTSGKPIAKPPQHHSYIVPGTEGKTHTASRRQNKELLEYKDSNIRTVYQLFQDSVKRFSNKECFGIREKLGDDKFGDFQWRNYGEIKDRVHQLASGLVHFGAKKGDKIGVYSINRPEWVETDFACQSQSLIPVALYDTLGKGAVEYIIEHSEISMVVCSGERVSRLLDVRDKCRSLHTIISMDKITPEQNDKAESLDVQLYDYEHVLQVGQENPSNDNPPTPDDLATIMYTSGTTGNPKGVMLTQRNLVSVAYSVQNEPYLDIGSHDVHMSYLPLAHIFERAVICTFFSVGASIGFYSGIIPKLFEDIQTLRPTFMVGAPRVFTRLVDKVKQKIATGSPIKRALFSYAYSQKNRALEQSRTTPVLDRIVFSKLKAALGGRVRWILSGSAPLDADVQRFMEVCFCTKVIQGYGLTETTAGSCVTLLHDYQGGHVGRPFQCCEVRLEDVPDMKYFASENRGEICIRGYSVTKGYYKDEAKTKEVLSDDGWFSTGDIGEFRENGTLAIIDRKKNIFKLSQGEYVAPEYLESVYSSSKFVQQIFVYGNSFRRFLVALVVPDPECLEIWAKENNITGDTSVPTLCRNDRLREAVLKDLNQVNKNMELKGFENIKNVHLLDEEFSVEKNTMTPTFKLRRYDITQNYKEILESLYNDIES